MIRLTRLNHDSVVVNADAIVYLESTPDTLLTLMNGDRVLVRESVDEVIDAATHYQQRLRVGDIMEHHSDDA